MRFWGWGEDAHAGEGLPAGGLAMLTDELGLEAGAAGQRVDSLDDVRVGESALGATARDALASVVGAEWVRDDHDARVLHAAGKSLPDLLRLRAGDAAVAPDAVVLAGSAAEVSGVLRACASAGVAVVPWGGGTSVVGGVEPLRGEHGAVVALDLSRLVDVEVDERSRLLRCGPGLALPALEARLAPHGRHARAFPAVV